MVSIPSQTSDCRYTPPSSTIFPASSLFSLSSRPDSRNCRLHPRLFCKRVCGVCGLDEAMPSYRQCFRSNAKIVSQPMQITTVSSLKYYAVFGYIIPLKTGKTGQLHCRMQSLSTYYLIIDLRNLANTVYNINFGRSFSSL